MSRAKSEEEISVDVRGRRRLQWLGVLGAWFIFSLLTTIQRYFITRPAAGGPWFLSSLAWALAIWAFWAAATPAIFWLGRRVPLRQRKLYLSLPAHFFFACLFGALHLACWAGIVGVYEFISTGTPGKFTQEFIRLAQILLYVEVILYWAILGAGLARHAFRQAQERELKAQALEAQLQQAQLLALKQQLHPHFLFNALNTIAMLARNGENQQVVQMIAELGEMLRWSIAENAAQEVTLAAELETARRYLAIEQFRLPDRLRVEVSVPEELLSAAVPNLILQPLVENAVRHGIAKSSSASLVRISAERQASTLELRVEDDGDGFPAEWQPGVGLRNTRARLIQAYGAQAELNVTRRETRGAGVQLRLPYRQPKADM